MRLMTMVQNMNKSVYVTKSATPFPKRTGGKEAHPL